MDRDVGFAVPLYDFYKSCISINSFHQLWTGTYGLDNRFHGSRFLISTPLRFEIASPSSYGQGPTGGYSISTIRDCDPLAKGQLRRSELDFMRYPLSRCDTRQAFSDGIQVRPHAGKDSTNIPSSMFTHIDCVQ